MVTSDGDNTPAPEQPLVPAPVGEPSKPALAAPPPAIRPQNEGRYPEEIETAYAALGEHAEYLAREVLKYQALWLKKQRLGLRKATLAWLRDGPVKLKEMLEAQHRDQLGELAEVDRRMIAVKTEIHALEDEVAVLEKAAGDDGRNDSPTGLSREEAMILRTTFARLQLVKTNQDLPPPDDVPSTGVLGKSRLFLFTLPNAANGMRVFAKFDRPDRARNEWLAIESLRALNVPNETILPLPKNMESDGVIIYPVAGDHSLTSFTTLGDYLQRHLEDSPRNNNTTRCLDMSMESLRFFYEIQPGRVQDRDKDRSPKDIFPYRWSHFFPEVPEEPDARTLLDRYVPSSGPAPGPSLPHPLGGLSRLGKTTGDLHLSRVHGDLNLTNVIVCPELDQSPGKVCIVDLADTKPSFATAVDLARLEVEVWHGVYLTVALSAGLTSNAVMEEVVAAHDALLGRRTSHELSPAAQGAVHILKHLRDRARTILGPRQSHRQSKSYRLHDYHYCLYFNNLTRLGWYLKKSDTDPNSVRLAALGASLALRFLQDWEHGHYSGGNRRH